MTPCSHPPRAGSFSPRTRGAGDGPTQPIGRRAQCLPSEGFSDIPDARGAPYTYWGTGAPTPTSTTRR